jgi:hypothetical protein
MNSKQFKLLIGIFFVVCGLGVVLLTRDRNSWQKAEQEMGGKVFDTFPLNDVAAITIAGSSNTLNLARSNDLWTVVERDGYPANYENVKGLLTKVWELKVVRPMKVGASQLGSLDLLDPGKGKNSGKLVVFKGKDGKELHTLLLGKEHTHETGDSSPYGGGGYPDGRYVMPDGKAAAVALVQETFSSVDPQPSSWLQRDFFKVEKPKSIEVTTTNSWKVTRETETGEWKLADPKPGETLDTTKTGSFNYALSSPSFEDVVVNTKLDDLGLTTPKRIVIETFEGFTYTIDAGKKDGEDTYYLKLAVKADLSAERKAGADEKPADKEKLDKEFKDKQDKLKEKLAKEESYGKWIYKVSNWTLNSLLKDRSELLKKEEPKAAEAKPPLAPTPPPADAAKEK